MSELDCKSCGGSRLNIESSNFKVADKSISEVSNVDMLEFSQWLDSIQKSLTVNELIIAEQIIKELKKRLQFFNRCWTFISHFK